MSPSPTSSGGRVSNLAKRIHGWSWQAFPIGMGTGAVYVSLSGLKSHSPALTHVETFFFFLNIALFLLNMSTLALQAVCESRFNWCTSVCLMTALALVYPRQSLRLIKDPVKGIFVPLCVLSFATIIIGTINYAVPTGHVHPGFIYELFWYAMCPLRCPVEADGFLSRVYVAFALIVCFPMLMIWSVLVADALATP